MGSVSKKATSDNPVVDPPFLNYPPNSELQSAVIDARGKYGFYKIESMIITSSNCLSPMHLMFKDYIYAHS
jgi:hypothetical protein